MNESPTARGMRRRGWRSSANLMKAAQGLLESGFVIQTRLGGRHLASLYALTWLQIDPCDGKLELAQIPRAPLNLWKDENRALRAAYQLVEKTPRRNFAAPPVERIAPRVVQ